MFIIYIYIYTYYIYKYIYIYIHTHTYKYTHNERTAKGLVERRGLESISSNNSNHNMIINNN